MRLILSLPFLFATAPAFAEPPRVLTDIAPVHSIVATVMAGVGEPALLIPPEADPHHFQMRPSQARNLVDAEALIWVGAALLPWLGSTAETNARNLKATVEMLAISDLPMVIKGRSVDLHEDEEGLDEIDEHEGHSHNYGDTDPHAWLDPLNGARLAMETARMLAQLDPANGETYEQNARAFQERIVQMVAELQGDLAPLQQVAMVTHHDGFAYFWNRFGLVWVGGISTGEGIPASAAQLAEMNERVDQADRTCLFSQNGVGADALHLLAHEGRAVRDLEEIGLGLEPGPKLYEALIRRIAETVKGCES